MGCHARPDPWDFRWPSAHRRHRGSSDEADVRLDFGQIGCGKLRDCVPWFRDVHAVQERVVGLSDVVFLWKDLWGEFVEGTARSDVGYDLEDCTARGTMGDVVAQGIVDLDCGF